MNGEALQEGGPNQNSKRWELLSCAMFIPRLTSQCGNLFDDSRSKARELFIRETEEADANMIGERGGRCDLDIALLPC